jgi:hypothetical protein
VQSIEKGEGGRGRDGCDTDGVEAQQSGFPLDRFREGHGLTLAAVESNNELDRAMSRTATPAGARNLGFPIRPVLIEPAHCLAALGNGRPRFGRAGKVGNETTGGYRHLAMLGTFPLCHAKAARLFRRGAEVGEILSYCV